MELVNLKGRKKTIMGFSKHAATSIREKAKAKFKAKATQSLSFKLLKSLLRMEKIQILYDLLIIIYFLHLEKAIVYSWLHR